MYFSIIFIHLVIQVKFSIADEETLSLKSSCSDLVLDSNTNQMIKSLSLYRDEVFLLYGNAKETSDVFLYNYWASQINMEKPLFGLFSEPKQPFKMGNNKKEFNTTVKHGKLNQFLPKIDEFIASNEIISMLRLNDQLVVIFLRSIFEHTNIVYLTYEWHGTNASKLLESGIVQASNNEASQSILLFHFNETKLVNKENISVCKLVMFLRTIKIHLFIYLDFISLNDPSYQMGTINIHNNRLQLFPTSTYSRFIGINGNMNTRLYLVEEREEGSKYPDFQPFSKKVSIGKWRALKFANYIYLLSGIHSGYVYYFKPDNLTRRDPNDSLVVPLGVMSYGRFFGCGVESGREPTFPPDTLIVHSLFVHSYICKFSMIKHTIKHLTLYSLF